MQFQVNKEALTRLRDFMVAGRQKLHLEMCDYVSETATHFCATSACLAGWGATERLEKDNPYLAPIYAKMDKWAEQFPVHESDANFKEVAPYEFLRILSSVYSRVVIDPDYPVEEVTTRILNTMNAVDNKNLETWQYIASDLDAAIEDEDIPMGMGGMDIIRCSPMWFFLFGAGNDDSINHAIWRMNYVLEHNDVPLIYSTGYEVASKVTWSQAYQAVLDATGVDLYTEIDRPESLCSSTLSMDDFYIDDERVRDVLTQLLVAAGDIVEE